MTNKKRILPREHENTHKSRTAKTKFIQSTELSKKKFQWMGRWRTSLLFYRVMASSKSINPKFCPNPPLRSSNFPLPRNRFSNFRSFSALPSPSPFYAEDFDYKAPNFDLDHNLELKENEDTGKILVKAFFLCTRFISLPLFICINWI